MNIDKKSYIYRANNFFNDGYKIKRLSDSCAYKRMTIYTHIKMILIAMVSLIFLGIIGGIINQEAGLNLDTWAILLSGLLAIVVTVALAIGVGVGFALTIEKMQVWNGKHRDARISLDAAKPQKSSTKEPGLISQWYDQAKNKYCTKLTFTE